MLVRSHPIHYVVAKLLIVCAIKDLTYLVTVSEIIRIHIQGIPWHKSAELDLLYQCSVCVGGVGMWEGSVYRM